MRWRAWRGTSPAENARPETTAAGKERWRPGAWQVGRVGSGGGREVGGGGETAT
jgi:hypothetical protein